MIVKNNNYQKEWHNAGEPVTSFLNSDKKNVGTLILGL
jgi:hypothetical protein